MDEFHAGVRVSESEAVRNSQHAINDDEGDLLLLEPAQHLRSRLAEQAPSVADDGRAITDLLGKLELMGHQEELLARVMGHAPDFGRYGLRRGQVETGRGFVEKQEVRRS